MIQFCNQLKGNTNKINPLALMKLTFECSNHFQSQKEVNMKWYTPISKSIWFWLEIRIVIRTRDIYFFSKCYLWDTMSHICIFSLNLKITKKRRLSEMRDTGEGIMYSYNARTKLHLPVMILRHIRHESANHRLNQFGTLQKVWWYETDSNILLLDFLKYFQKL